MKRCSVVHIVQVHNLAHIIIYVTHIKCHRRIEYVRYTIHKFIHINIMIMDFNVHCAVLRTIHINKSKTECCSLSFNLSCMAYMYTHTHKQQQQSRAQKTTLKMGVRPIFRCRAALLVVIVQYQTKSWMVSFSTSVYSLHALIFLQLQLPSPPFSCSSAHFTIYHLCVCY